MQIMDWYQIDIDYPFSKIKVIVLSVSNLCSKVKRWHILLLINFPPTKISGKFLELASKKQGKKICGNSKYGQYKKDILER